MTSPLDLVRFVLVRTSHPGNIGSAARAIRTMGLHRLELVAPEAFPHAEATALAAGAGDVIEAATQHAALPAAIGDCRLVLGATARRRGVVLEELDPRAAAQRVLDAALGGHRVALLFGNERSGLDNDEIKHCHAGITIPADPTYSSLNLAQAVQVVAWELRMAWLERQADATPARGDARATAAEMEQFFAHLARTLDAIDFHKGRSPERILQRLRRVFLRAAPDARELRMLHGVLADATRMAGLARSAKGGGPGA
ncbi:RNA methyltransferase [Dokdonella fugitiva]|uniref:tRNA (cytidine/uridine-2'-O-)-methyltransferase TrmJ n=1 Tax=Dokdonella fugitiva TaxID=328517 RepID=A0A4R2ICT0_9GAMM|nr:RNA methyltransferase [Dokdonella fugitiva]MBA8883958.1 tRNA (cytidine32/uridine32-2'-O)-methyltransferase [Dokdonella fugitiva]TCO41946.1 tRNA (cytidine32/uridine32-2'-O)-methyltransferase [Dokdonella fugitiva]